MKYCSHCGAEAKDDAKFCEYCGNQFAVVNNNVNENVNTQNTNVNGTPSNTQPESTALGICALIFSCLGGWLGLVLAIICLATKRDKTNRTLGTIALIISIIWLFIEILLYSTGVWTFNWI